jgi:hypothetical protein
MLVNVALPVAGRRRRRMTQQSQAEIMGPDWLRTFEGVEPMGRGRAKAKQVKVARQLKYKSDDTDLDRLRTELGVGADSRDSNSAGVYDDEDDEDSVADDAEDAEDAWLDSPGR